VRLSKTRLEPRFGTVGASLLDYDEDFRYSTSSLPRRTSRFDAATAAATAATSLTVTASRPDGISRLMLPHVDDDDDVDVDIMAEDDDDDDGDDDFGEYGDDGDDGDDVDAAVLLALRQPSAMSHDHQPSGRELRQRVPRTRVAMMHRYEAKRRQSLFPSDNDATSTAAITTSTAATSAAIPQSSSSTAPPQSSSSTAPPQSSKFSNSVQFPPRLLPTKASPAAFGNATLPREFAERIALAASDAANNIGDHYRDRDRSSSENRLRRVARRRDEDRERDKDRQRRVSRQSIDHASRRRRLTCPAQDDRLREDRQREDVRC
jgi:hypothetical protein